MNHFEYYKKQATTTDLSDTERVGRYASQQDDETHIFDDVVSKLPALTQKGSTIVDIGCGCSDPVKRLIANADAHQQQLVLVDSEEMLARLPEQNNITKAACQFPNKAFVEQYQGKADAIIVYSVFHCVYLQNDFITFADSLVQLLAPGGSLLLADLPNATKKKRFLSSEQGQSFHRQWSGDDNVPDVNWNQFEAGSLDDSLVMMLMARYRQMGYETYLLPQKQGLPFSNTREDLCVTRW